MPGDDLALNELAELVRMMQFGPDRAVKAAQAAILDLKRRPAAERPGKG